MKTDDHRCYGKGCSHFKMSVKALGPGKLLKDAGICEGVEKEGLMKEVKGEELVIFAEKQQS